MRTELTPDSVVTVLPAQLIELSDGIVLRRGSVEILLAGSGWLDLVPFLFSILRRRPSRVAEVLDLFEQNEREYVHRFLDQLHQRRILVEVEDTRPCKPESNEDIFYWDFNWPLPERVERLRSFKIGLIGINAISAEIIRILQASSLGGIFVVDEPRLRNLSLFSGGGDLPDPFGGLKALPSLDEEGCFIGEEVKDLDGIIGTSEFGDTRKLLQWNKISQRHRVPFIPVLLRQYVGSVGPVVIPKETACFHCLLVRQNSNRHDWGLLRTIEDFSCAGQATSGVLPGTSTILAGITVVEMMKLFFRIPKWQPGVQVEAMFLDGTFTSSKVLKLPPLRIVRARPPMGRVLESIRRTFSQKTFEGLMERRFQALVNERLGIIRFLRERPLWPGEGAFLSLRLSGGLHESFFRSG